MRTNSKEAIVDAAVYLFNTKGFSGTSIRDIAARAGVNPANISYYFQNKNGLLEYCFTSYFENYLHELEKGYSLIEDGARVSLKKIVQNLLKYQFRDIELTRFILRELTLDTQIVREVMSTYQVKERYLLKKVIERGMRTKEFRSLSVPYIILQLKSLLTTPFLNVQYVNEVLHLLPHEKYFVEKYCRELDRWIDTILCEPSVITNRKAASI
ncbi:forespore capture DNA-binding protein RefZ [Bacillus sp. B15-48]|uniref:forespore capture DNA-binding protein RefZ n=1 Tax=Bacillus sp. B15-48 TaxID=1548601 RepID=UPI00193EF251|nr:forespore capture DNA-binding protein RefZ [Bacillus sp. B15-48]MBM4762574.1 forespore capture DNA-binding protein RefZ [Bacillus sp. B15-48]